MKTLALPDGALILFQSMGAVLPNATSEFHSPLEQAASLEVAEVSAAGTFDHVDGEF